MSTICLGFEALQLTIIFIDTLNEGSTAIRFTVSNESALKLFLNCTGKVSLFCLNVLFLKQTAFYKNGLYKCQVHKSKVKCGSGAIITSFENTIFSYLYGLNI